MPIGPGLWSIAWVLALGAPPPVADADADRPRLEKLDRGLVAVPAPGGGNHLSWRLLGDDPAGTAFHLYRGSTRITPRPLTGATSFLDGAGTPDSRYTVRAVLRGREGRADRAVGVWRDGYLSVPIAPPPGGVSPDGVAFTYTANDASVGDLDGDGRYEIILKWDPTNSKDNAFHGFTGNVVIDAYTLEGRRLWRIDLGRNIRAGAHYTQFLVYDFDGDGRAELVAKTGDGTIDGRGKTIGDAKADWRWREGFELQERSGTGTVKDAAGRDTQLLIGRIGRGQEYLTVFDGRTGAALATADYDPPRHPDTAEPSFAQATAAWGDAYANRSDRFLAGVAYLDGARPSIVMARGYYARSTLAAWDWRGGRLTKRWLFDSATPGNQDYAGQGNHQLSVADVDADGRDEIVYGAMAIDDDGKGLWSSGLFHGDALHVSDLDPTRHGLERFAPHESPGKNGGIGTAMLDARTGAVLWSTPSDRDVGRGVAIDIDPRHPGTEQWAWYSDTLYDARGKAIGNKAPGEINFGIWWDGDLSRELLDKTQISKWDWRAAASVPLLVANGVASNNGTKATPALSADILGDWREEVIWRTEDSRALRIYATPHVTTHRLVTLMHDRQYRLAVAWQNVAYNQPPHPSFFIGEGMAEGTGTPPIVSERR